MYCQYEHGKKLNFSFKSYFYLFLFLTSNFSAVKKKNKKKTQTIRFRRWALSHQQLRSHPFFKESSHGEKEDNEVTSPVICLAHDAQPAHMSVHPLPPSLPPSHLCNWTSSRFVPESSWTAALIPAASIVIAALPYNFYIPGVQPRSLLTDTDVNKAWKQKHTVPKPPTHLSELHPTIV